MKQITMPAAEVECKEGLASVGTCLGIIVLPPSAQKPGIVNSVYSVALFSIQHLVPKLSIYTQWLNQKKPTRKEVKGGNGAMRFTPFLCLFFLFTLSSSSRLHSIRKLEITAPSQPPLSQKRNLQLHSISGFHFINPGT